MMNIDHLTHLFTVQFTDKEISPASIEEKINAVNKALEVYDTERIPVWVSFGEPRSVEDDPINDWTEYADLSVKDIPEDVANTAFKVYDIFYDGEEGYIDIMLIGYPDFIKEDEEGTPEEPKAEEPKEE